MSDHNCNNIEVLAVAMNGAYSTGVMHARSKMPMKKRYETAILQQSFEDGYKSIKSLDERLSEAPFRRDTTGYPAG